MLVVTASADGGAPHAGMRFVVVNPPRSAVRPDLAASLAERGERQRNRHSEPQERQGSMSAHSSTSTSAASTPPQTDSWSYLGIGSTPPSPRGERGGKAQWISSAE